MKKLVDVKILVELFGSVFIVDVKMRLSGFVFGSKDVFGFIVDSNVVIFVSFLIKFGCDVRVVDMTTIAAITTPEPTVNITCGIIVCRIGWLTFVNLNIFIFEESKKKY